MITLMGAAPDTGNQGVSALCASAVDGLTKRGIGPIAITDHGIGRREMPDGTLRIGLTNHRRLWRGDCMRVVAQMTRFGGLTSASARTIAQSRAVLDVSGGDSFTDLYGAKRFAAMTLSKYAALRAGRPLILLPQTMGPFREEASRAVAVDILRQARAVWVRDARSERILQELLGKDYDPEKHHRGPDMAVLLPAVKPDSLPKDVATMLAETRDFPVAGLNVSGLLWQKDDEAKGQFGLKDSHRAQIEAIARTVLDSAPEMRLVLISHVIRPEGDFESDFDAARALAARLAEAYPGRIAVLPQDYDATGLKWVLGQLDWFAGARMHATIGAFSSGVPTLGLGYSDKAEGVFDECGLVGQVADLRQLDTPELIARTRASVAARSDMRAQLARDLPGFKARAEATMDKVAALIGALPK